MPRQNAVLAIIVASYMMIVIDISIAITGLPRIQAELGFSTHTLSWVQNAYTLAFGGLLLLGARAGDLLGRRRMYLAGLALFTAASVAIGLAPSPEWMLAGRAAQGIGAAVLTPSTLALLSTHFAEGPERSRAVGWYAAAAGIGASLGLVLGGLFADLLSWRVGFFMNLPIGLALMLAARRHLVETERHTGRFDVAGAVLSTLGMTALVYGIVRSASEGWADGVTLGAIVAGVAFLALLVWNEAFAAQPIMPLRLFVHRERAGAYVARILFLGAMVGFWFFTTQVLQGVLGYRPALAGLAFLPTTLPNFLAAMAVAKLTQRFGNGRLMIAGLLLSMLGLGWLGAVSVDTAYFPGIALPMVLIGIGQGFALAPLTVSAMAGVAPADAGAASGLVNAAHQLGASLGLAVLVVVFAMASSGSAAGPAQLATGASAVFLAGTAMLALATLVATVTILPRRA